MEGRTHRFNKRLVWVVTQEVLKAVNIDLAIDKEKVGVG
jgi:hypothetical protein